MNLNTQGFSSIFLALVIVCSSSFSATISAQEPSGGSQFIPPDEEYDWIQLSSGEWLKGELIGLFDDKVEFDSEVLDKLYIDIDDVIGIHSRRTYAVTVRGEGLITGRIVVENNELLVDTGKGKTAVPIESLVALTASAEKRRDRWSGEINLGLNLRQGNTERVEYNMIAGFARRTDRSRVLIDYIGSYNRTDDIETANDHRVNMTWDRFSGSRLFWRPFLGQYLRDPFQNIDHQVTLETGLGYELIRNRRTEWEIFAGAGVNYVQRKSVEEGQASSSSSPAFTLGTSFDTELTDSTDYHFSFQMTFLDEESGEYQHHLVTTLSTKLIGNLDLNFSFIWDRTDAPPPLADGSFAEKDDFRFITGIGFDF
jgi:hypothetical protein